MTEPNGYYLKMNLARNLETFSEFQVGLNEKELILKEMLKLWLSVEIYGEAGWVAGELAGIAGERAEFAEERCLEESESECEESDCEQIVLGGAWQAQQQLRTHLLSQRDYLELSVEYWSKAAEIREGKDNAEMSEQENRDNLAKASQNRKTAAEMREKMLKVEDRLKALNEGTI
jgi:hypothetical protein